MFDWLRKIFMVKVVGKGYFEDGHWVTAPYYWVWRWNNEE